MAIALNAVSSGQNDGASSITVSHTVAGTNTLLVVKTHCEANTSPANRPVTGITYNSVALTKADDESFTSPGGEDDATEIWYLIAPTDGTNDCVVTFTGVVDGCVVAVESYTGVAQTSPLDVVASTSATSTGPAEVGITTTVANCVLVGAVQTISSSRTLTANSGQTQNYNIQNVGQLKAAGGYEIVTSAQLYTESWTIDASTDWLIVVAAFKPAVAATTLPSPRRMMMGIGV